MPVAFIPMSPHGSSLCLLNQVSPSTSMSPEVLIHFEFINTWDNLFGVQQAGQNGAVE